MTPTPRTDALLDPVKGTVAFNGPCAEFARELERENAKLREKVENQAARIRVLEGATNHAGGLHQNN